MLLKGLGLTAIATALAAIASQALAQQAVVTNRGGGFACTTRSAFDELSKAAAAQDKSWVQRIPGCGILKVGSRVTIKSLGFAVSEIYVHPPGGGRPVLVWTHTENISIKR